jgi:Ca2+-binding EF-hand superfamily protein
MNRKVAVTLGVFGLFAAALLLSAGPASACCTAVLCPYAVSSSSQCVGGTNMPVCNIAGCNCNVQCGMYTWDTTGGCHFSTTCSLEAANDAKARFDEIDADHNGKISLAELDAWGAKQKDLAKNMKAKDLKASLKSGFAKADKNHDGSITPAELDDSLGAPAKK